MNVDLAPKLIEVALPLEAINEAARREKSIRHGHPSTLHLWWARRPLAAARAVIFAQMVDDPSVYLSDHKAIETERRRLFRLIESLVQWKNTGDVLLLEKARAEIRRSWARRSLGTDVVAKLTDRDLVAKFLKGDIEPLPSFHDPFAGGGSLPLEAERLGLTAYASDLNPVAVLINKAMVDFAPRFSGMPPINPDSRAQDLATKTWMGTQGLAEDVRYYGRWMRDQALNRIGHLYPTVHVTKSMTEHRPDLAPFVGQKLTIIAWIWARTVKSPNPAFSEISVPLITTFVLSSKNGIESYVEPLVDERGYTFEVRYCRGHIPAKAKAGTKLDGSNFRCLMSDSVIDARYIRTEAQAGRMGMRLVAAVAEGVGGRVYLSPNLEMEAAFLSADPEWKPELVVPRRCHDVDRLPMYGMPTWGDAFTPRQLVALTTFSDLVSECRDQVRVDAAGCSGQSGAVGFDDDVVNQYADAIALYLGLGVGRCANYWSSLTPWGGDFIVQTFGRNAIRMVWDFAEANPFSTSTGNWLGAIDWIERVISTSLVADGQGVVVQEDAQKQTTSKGKVISTDPPYYDNIGYAELSDFFYVWLRRALHDVFPNILSTLAVPKSEELVAASHRHGTREKAESYFLDGMTQAMRRIAEQCHSAFPVTIYYAFKQSETRSDCGVFSTGWETFLEAVLNAGLSISGTWPVRTERDQGLKTGSNVLASSIVLVCRKRDLEMGFTTRRNFQAQLRRELPDALRNLQQGNIAPVDLAQSSIGPGMSIFSRFSKVVEADGAPMKVRTALALINEALDEILAEQEGELDADSRWAIAWFGQYGFGEGPFGDANVLCNAKGTAVGGLERGGIVYAKSGKVNLLRREEMDAEWDPATDSRLTVWEAVQHLILKLEGEGELAAASLLAKLGDKAEQARDLAYRLYNTCERKGWADEARSYNGLVIAWPELTRLAAQEPARPGAAQSEMNL